MDMDALLMQELGKFIQCSHHALYFPTTHAPRQPELLPRERRLLLPLYRQGSLLGVLMLHGVKVRDARLLLPQLPAIADLCLELLARVKATRVDAVTGLATENVLYGSMEDEAARVREIFADPSRGDGQSSPLHRLCMGLVLLHFSNGREIVGRMGFRFADELMRRAAEALQEELPSDVVAARVGRFGMALLLPSVSGRSACQKMAEAALARMAGAAMPAPLTGRTIRPRLSAGHAVYPQDMEGAELRLPMFEQARMLMERARLAARMTSQPGAPRVMPFARILQDGGTVLRALPQGRVRVGLGAQAKAREGMRFAVWGPSGQEGSGNQYKGEVVLLQVREFHSVAETVHLADATAPLEAGDRLSLLEVPSLAASHPHTPGGKTAAADASGTPGQERTAAADKETEEASAAGSVQEVRARIPVLEDGSCAGIYGHGDFLHLFAQEKERTGRFVLAIVRVDVPHDARQEAALGECLAAWRQIPELCAGEPLAGLYGSNALIFFHADSSAETLLPHYAALCTRLEGAGLPVSAGLAGYPLLHYRKGEMPDCALKALEYAQLLPSPRAGLCNSLALNISADRRYALGDVFGAIDEYKLALLADAENVLARNSLGVCMAALGRYHEARRHFLEALRYKGDAGPERQERIAQTHYNLGTVCQQLGERRAAARYYRECIKDAPEHVYAHLRLGQLCEEGGRRNEARRFYELAAAIEDRQEQAGEQRPSLARRYLARLAARQRHGGEARELLHDTLLRNPFDAAAMLLLARLYLDGDEDPAMAELLARKSVGLRDTPEGWQVLARALRALGREEEASLAEAHASVG